MSCKVGNQTNSQDPQAVNSRVFVGNLNTFQCNKVNVERRFQRYGRIAGISMHKGYAFIQFTNPFDARSACLGEDGRLLWGQTLDVNLVAEPKSHQTGRKRQNHTKTGNDWDYYYDSYYAQVGFPPTPRLIPPMKRARTHVPSSSRSSSKTSTTTALCNNNSPRNTSLSGLKSYSTPDILICGNCRELFTEIEQLMEHKKNYCKLRFTCKCHVLNGCKQSSLGDEPASLLCSQCKDSFHSAWDLMVHVQTAHLLNIYQLGSDVKNEDSKEDKGENGVNGTDVITSTGNEMIHRQQQQQQSSLPLALGLTSSCNLNMSTSTSSISINTSDILGDENHKYENNNSSTSTNHNINTLSLSDILSGNNTHTSTTTSPTPPIQQQQYIGVVGGGEGEEEEGGEMETQIQYQMNGNTTTNTSFPTEASTQTLTYPLDTNSFNSDNYTLLSTMNGGGDMHTNSVTN